MIVLIEILSYIIKKLLSGSLIKKIEYLLKAFLYNRSMSIYIDLAYK